MAIKMTEARIAQMERDGYGQGTHANYKPWVSVHDFSSLGRSRRVWGHKTHREHHLLSDVEHNLFIALEWARDVVDIREQFPLDRSVTQEIARQLGIRHPCYPGGNVPVVMTVDFMATRVVEGREVFEAFAAKRSEEAEDERSLALLELARQVCALLDTKHHVVFHDCIPVPIVKNLEWIRGSLVKPKEQEPRPGFWADVTARLTAHIAGNTSDERLSLADYCSEFDAIAGFPTGSGIRAARMLLATRVLETDLSAKGIESLPMSKFTLTAAPARPGQLYAVGGQ